MITACPGYISNKNLPLASDIFYHRKIRYLAPTGFTPVEINNVFDFPAYCDKKNIRLPGIIWEMCNSYFINSSNALQAFNIMEPLHENNYDMIMTSYPRDIKAIEKAKVFLIENPHLVKIFDDGLIDPLIVSRETLSHILYGVYLESGNDGAVSYIMNNSKTIDDLKLLILATIINRLNIFAQIDSELLIYNQEWLPFIDEVLKNTKKSDCKWKNSDERDIELMTYKLFEAIITPIFGSCDEFNKNRFIAETNIYKIDSIQELKNKCNKISTEIILMNTDSENLKEKYLKELLSKNIIEPFGELIDKPKNDINKLVFEILLESGVVGGLLTLVQGMGVETLVYAMAAGTISTGAKYLYTERNQKSDVPSELLLAGLKEMRKDYAEYEKKIYKMLNLH
jgi:hypothetical protein